MILEYKGLVKSALNNMVNEQAILYLSKVESLHNLQRIIQGCKLCKRRFDCLSPLPPIVSPNPAIAMIGRDSSLEDDKIGAIFAKGSPSRPILEDYLKELGLSFSDVHLTNTVFCHGHKYRIIESDEMAACSNFKLAELFLMPESVKHLILMGNDAFKMIIGTPLDSATKCHGFVYHVDFEMRGRIRRFTAVVVYHPGFLFQKPEYKEPVLQILKEYRKRFIDEAYED